MNVNFDDIESLDMDFNTDNEPHHGSRDDTGGFGGGLEFLMNTDKKSHSSKARFGDFDRLEGELDELTGSHEPIHSFSTKFGGFDSDNIEIVSENGGNYGHTPNVGKHTMHGMSSNNPSFDNYSKINDVPTHTSANHLSDRQQQQKKRIMLRKLDKWYEKKILKTEHGLTMDSPFDEVEDEYTAINDEIQKASAVAVYKNWLAAMCGSLEFVNKYTNLFDVSLEGFSEQIEDDIDSYNDVLEELHDKYKAVRTTPEISLLLKLGISCGTVIATNKMMANSPEISAVLQSNPDLLASFKNAASNMLNQQNPEAGNFMDSLMGSKKDPVTNYGPPPLAQNPRTMNFTSNRTDRPDLVAGRAMYQESGTNMQQSQENFTRQEQTPMQPAPRVTMTQGPRRELSAPNTDFSSLLQGLKVKSNVAVPDDDNVSIVSMSVMSMADGAAMPRARRTKSDKNKNRLVLDI